MISCQATIPDTVQHPSFKPTYEIRILAELSYCRRAAQRDGPPFFSAGAQTPPEKWAREAPPADAESRHRAATSAEAFLDYSPGGQPEESPRPTASRTPPVAERQNYETFPSISSTVNYLLVLKKTIFLPTILRYFYIDTNVFLIRGRFPAGEAARSPGAADSGKSAALPMGAATAEPPITDHHISQ